MCNRIVRFSIILILSLLITSLNFAQRQSGSLYGTVVDEGGEPLPGATVTISGPTLLGNPNYITGNSGKFRFPSLLPGEYSLTAEMPGFKTLHRKGLVINVGKTTEVTLVVESAPIKEEVTVTADSPVVDVKSTKISIHYDSEVLASMPASRDLYNIQNSMPGAISDERPYRRTSSILGGTVRSQLYALDGVPMNDPVTNYSMVNINVDVYEEIEFEIASHPAEVGQTDGAYINIITKSGGNRFSGGVMAYYSGGKLTQDLFTPEQISALGVFPAEKFTDFRDGSVNFGGFLVKDRIWFYLNGRRLTWDQANPLTPENRLAKLGMTSPHYDFRHEEWMAFAKLTFQLSKNVRYMGMFHFNDIYEPVYTNRTGSNYTWSITAIWNHEKDYTTTHQINWVLDQNTFLDIRGSYIYRFFPINTRPEFHGDYTYYDRTAAVSWGASWYDDEYVRERMNASLSLTRFQDEFLGASHEFKAGIDIEQTFYYLDRFRPGGNPYYTYWRDYNQGNPYWDSTSKRQGRLRIRSVASEREKKVRKDHTRRFSGYVQDNMAWGRWVVNLGVRFDYSYQYEPDQSRSELRYDTGPEFLAPGLAPNSLLEALIDQWHAEIGPISPFDQLTLPYKKVMEFFTVSPRLGLVYDVFGTGKTALKLSFARYFEPIFSAKYNNSNILSVDQINWYWYDDNKNKLMDLPPTDRYILLTVPEQDPNYKYYVDNLKDPYTDEIMASVQHELAKDFRLGLGFIWKRSKNIIEDIDLNNGYDPLATDEKGLIWIPYDVVDPGWDGEFGTDDDQNLTVYGLREDRPAPTWKGTNPPEAVRRYWATFFYFNKRMSNRWQLNGSILYSSFKGNTEAHYSATEGASARFDSPNRIIHSYGPLQFDRPLQIGLMTTFLLPLDFYISAYFSYKSGGPWARSLSRVYFPPEYEVRDPYVTVIAEPRGSQRFAPVTHLSLRLEKSFHLGDYGKLNFYIDGYNIGGSSGVEVTTNPLGWLYYYEDPPRYRVNSTYGLINSVYGVRSIRLGLRWTF